MNGLLEHVVAGAAAFAAGGVNALAGGGTLISFPVLVALGVPPVAANVTNTVALCPGYLGGTWAQREAVAAQRDRLRRIVPAAMVGGLLGSLLLLVTSDDTFRNLIPVLLFLAALLLATQDRIRKALKIGGSVESADRTDPRWLVVPILVVSMYGGYFGAGLGIMLLGVLGVVIHDRLDRLNALKQMLSFVINVTAAVSFLWSGKVQWSLAAVMAVAALIGGNLGGRVAGIVKPKVLRTLVVSIGLVVSIAYAIKLWA